MLNLRLPATHTEGVCYNRGITLSNQLSAVIPICCHSHRGNRERRGSERECAASAPVAHVPADCWFDGKLVL